MAPFGSGDGPGAAAELERHLARLDQILLEHARRTPPAPDGPAAF